MPRYHQIQNACSNGTVELPDLTKRSLDTIFDGEYEITRVTKHVVIVSIPEGDTFVLVREHRKVCPFCGQKAP